eukprot:5027324-Prymnesium_polylepis.1
MSLEENERAPYSSLWWQSARLGCSQRGSSSTTVCACCHAGSPEKPNCAACEVGPDRTTSGFTSGADGYSTQHTKENSPK